MRNNHRRKLLALLVSGGLCSTLFQIMPVQAEQSVWIEDEDLRDIQTQAPAKDDVLPDANQYRYQKAELAAFCHFGPNTFNEIEWGENYGSQSPAQIFRLTNDFDEETYVKALKDAGFTKLIVTAKHHDGFCIWDSAYTDYDAPASGYQDGKGDVLAELSAACTKYGLEMGLYLSPWDIHDDSYGYKDAQGNNLVGANGQPLNGRSWEEVYALDARDYNEYYNNQLQEILGNDKYGNNGHFTEVWMDGAKGSGASVQNYDFTLWFNTIQENEGIAAGYDADCMLFGAESYTGVRWIGNENGYAYKDTWSKSITDRQANTIDSNTQGSYTVGWENGNQWTVPEADARITSGWFWGNQKKTPKTISDLASMYFGSVGNNSVLLLNIPPNDQGTVDEAILERVAQFGQEIEQTFQDNLAASANATISASSVWENAKEYSPAHLNDGNDETVWAAAQSDNSASVLIDLGRTRSFDVISIEEAIQFGQRINSWKVEVRSADGQWKTIDEGETIGAHKLIRFGALRADQVRITVSVPEGKVPVLSQVGVYKASEGFELTSSAPDGMDVLDIESSAFSFTGTWYAESGDQYINGTNKYANPGASTTLSFTGSRAWLIGTVDPNHGTADIYVDDEFVQTIDMSASVRALGQKIFDTGDLSDGQHTIRVETRTKATGIECAYAINNGGKGMIGLEEARYFMNEDETMEVKLVRYGGDQQPVTVTLSPNPGSAIQDDFDTELISTITFEAGETEKTAPVRTRRNTNVTGNRQFTIELSSQDEDVILGFNDRATVEINDSENMNAGRLQELVDQAALLDPNLVDGDWTALDQAIAQAKTILANSGSTVAQIQSAYDALGAVMDGFVVRDAFSEASPFVFPERLDQSTTLEAEFGILTDVALASDGQWSLQVSQGDWASNGKFVNCLNQQDVVEFPYVASHAGTYQVTVYYRSGDPKNNLVWSEPDGKIAAGSVVAGAGDGAQATHSVTFTVEILEPGAGVWTFVGPDDKSPQLDRFEIVPLELVKESFTIITTASAGGTITPGASVEEGESFECLITPDEGYEIADVLVNGQSVGAQSRVVVEEVSEDTTIEAIFQFVHYSAAHPFEMPLSTGVLEAEEMELHNTGQNEAWPMQISAGSWCGNGKFLNAMNTNDTATLYYNAPKTGRYEVTLYFRSGDAQNGFSWQEANGKIAAGSVTAGANDSAQATHTVTFVWEVLEAGPGELILEAFERNAPQMDRFELVWQVDVQGLMDVIEQAESLLENEDEWSKASVEHLRQVVEQAKTLLEGTADQESVDEAVAAIEEAIAALEPAQIQTSDKRLLQAALEYAWNLELPETLNELVRTALESAMANAQAVLDNANASQEMVDEAWRELTTAIHQVGFTSDKSALQALVDQAVQLDRNQYEDDEAMAAFEEALIRAQHVLEDPIALDEVSIAQAVNDLATAMQNLNLKTPQEIDLSLLRFLIESVQDTDLSLYVQAGQAEFMEALEQGHAVLTDPQSQAEVDGAVAVLSQAWLNLRLKADESLLGQLKDFVNFVETMDLSTLDPTLADRVTVFTAALQQALTQHESGQQELDQQQASVLADQAIALRQEAEKALSSAAETKSNPSAQQDVQSASVHTATATHAHLLAGAAAALLGTLEVIRRKKK